jgi:hypothetical protein
LFETRHTGNIKTGEIKLSNEELVKTSAKKIIMSQELPY